MIKSDQDNINVIFKKDFISEERAKELFNIFEKNIKYNSDEESKVYMFDKYIKIPRKQIAYSDGNLGYSFSGTKVNAIDWNTALLATSYADNEICKVLKEIRDQVEKYLNKEFNFVLINRYNDGEDYIGPHHDSENDLKHSTIVGVSFGSSRNLILKSNKDVCIDVPNRIKMELNNGSLYAMCDKTNKNWKHSIPKMKNMSTRISLTFRCMKLKN